jgi:hypothetical protein
MPTSRRAAWLVLLLGVGLLVAILFHSFLLDNVVVPVATLFWLLWRLVQSVHQALYWGLVIAAAGAVVVYRLLRALMALETTLESAPETILKSVAYWRTWVEMSDPESQTAHAFQRELSQMLANMYAAREPEPDFRRLREALRLGQLSLPPRVYAFLFPDQASPAEQPWRQTLRRWAGMPRKWIRRATGREKADYRQVVGEMIAFMESLMEIKHGDEFFDHSHH